MRMSGSSSLPAFQHLTTPRKRDNAPGSANVVFDPFNDPLLKSSAIEMTRFTRED